MIQTFLILMSHDQRNSKIQWKIQNTSWHLTFHFMQHDVKLMPSSVFGFSIGF